MELQRGFWINPPAHSEVTSSTISLTTDPGTDFWQRTFYGFQNNNAPAYLISVDNNFTFSCRAGFDYSVLFDQAGILVWIDQFNWIKASIEFDNDHFSRLGVVVTNNGYSDWSTRNIATTNMHIFRVSRRGPDFLLESKGAPDEEWEQLRICHLAVLGETTKEIATAKPDEIPVPGYLPGDVGSVSVGIYACSPGESSFPVTFDQVLLTESGWMPHA